MFTQEVYSPIRKRWTWKDERIESDEPAFNGNYVAVGFGVAVALVVIVIGLFA